MHMNYAWTQAEFPHLSWKMNEPLAPFTYFRIGGPADALVTVFDPKDLEGVVQACVQHGAPWTVLGGASNVLVSDNGIRGVVIINRSQGVEFRERSNGVVELEAASGVSVNVLVRETVNRGLAGMTPFLGLPGTLGGAVVNNSHYSRQLIGEMITEVDVLTAQGQRKTYKHEDLKFDYDYSVLQETKEAVLRVRLRLTHGDKETLEQELREAVTHRTETQPIGQPSSGCMFQNVVLPDGTRESAGKLIDKAGCKGMRRGDAEVSSVHANFIVNMGNAKAADVLALAEEVRSLVQEKFGVTLHREVFLLGDWSAVPME